MKKKNRFTYLIIPLCILASCNSKSENKEVAEFSYSSENPSVATADMREVDDDAKSTTNSKLSEDLSDNFDVIEHKSVIEIPRTNPMKSNFVASAAASIANDNESHKFIRTANLKIKVEDVPKATYIIEDIALKNKGFIIQSRIDNSQNNSYSINISPDSTLIVHTSNLTTSITLKVPKTQLDTTLKQIAPLALVIDYRIVEAKDITLRLLSEQLTKERKIKKQNRLSNAINNTGRKLNDIIEAENPLDESLEAADQAIIETFNINEQIEFSKIEIQLYQNQIKYREVVLRQQDVEEYKPGFFKNAWLAITDGCQMICSLAIELLKIWPIIIIVTACIFSFFQYRKRKNQK